jgi:hypothetical protein
MSRNPTPEQGAAERLAVLVEDPTTPPLVRGLIQQACATIDTHAATDEEAASGAFAFGSMGKITPTQIRRRLAARLHKVAEWRTDGSVVVLYSPDEKGARSMRLSDRFGQMFERLLIRTGHDATSMRRETARIIAARRGDTAPLAPRTSHACGRASTTESAGRR